MQKSLKTENWIYHTQSDTEEFIIVIYYYYAKTNGYVRLRNITFNYFERCHFSITNSHDARINNRQDARAPNMLANLCVKTFTIPCARTYIGIVSGSSKKEEKRFNLSFCAAHFCSSSRPCCGIASLIVTEELASSVLITDDDVVVTSLRIMLKPLSRKSQELSRG